MARPAVRVEIAFDSGYATPAASRTWTDVTEYVRIVDGIDITHGRGDERSQADANSLRLTLKNSDGRFTPGLASSPYYPNVKLGRPVRVSSLVPGNLCTNPSFENNTTGWSGFANCSIARINTAPFSGTWHLEMTATGAGNMTASTSTGVNGVPVTEGFAYSLQARFRTPVTARSCRTQITWFRAAGTAISSTVGQTVADAVGSYALASLTGTAPAEAVFARIDCTVLSAAASEVHWVDAVMLEHGSTVSTFAAGHSVGWEWEGTAQNSVSLKPDYRFTGFIDEWPLEWPAVVDTFATSTITATSRHARLGSSAPLSNHIYEEYKRDSPVAHFMLDNLADSVAGGTSLKQVGTGTAVTFEGTGPTDGIQAAQFAASGKALRAAGGTVMPPSLTAFTVECFVLDNGGAQILAVVPPGELEAGTSGERPGYGYFELRTTSGGLPVAEFTDTGGTNDLISGATSITGATHHLAVTFTNSGNMVLYVDGVNVGSAAVGTWPTLAQDFVVGLNSAGATGALTVAHVAVFDSVLTAARIAAHSDAGLDGFAGETAEDRLKRYAAWASIPTAEQSISTDADTPMAYIDTTGRTVLSLLQKVEETDGGVLYDSRDDLLTYAARSARYNTAAAVTLTAGQVEASYAPKLDRSSIINEVVATIADGSDPQETLTARDQDSYDDYGPHRDDIELATTDPDQAHAAAWWRVNTYGEPLARAPQLGVEIAHLSTALQASVLGLKVGDKITITGLPSQSDAASKSFFVEGYTERIGETTHHFDFNVSPAEGFNVWVLDDATYSVLGTTTKLAY